MRPQITIAKEVLFQLMHSHSRLSQAEYERNKAYNDSHFSAQTEHAIISELASDSVAQYFAYIAKMEARQ